MFKVVARIFLLGALAFSLSAGSDERFMCEEWLEQCSAVCDSGDSGHAGLCRMECSTEKLKCINAKNRSDLSYLRTRDTSNRFLDSVKACNCQFENLGADCVAEIAKVGSWITISTDTKQCVRVDWYSNSQPNVAVVSEGIYTSEWLGSDKDPELAVQFCRVCKENRKPEDDPCHVSNSHLGMPSLECRAKRGGYPLKCFALFDRLVDKTGSPVGKIDIGDPRFFCASHEENIRKKPVADEYIAECMGHGREMGFTANDIYRHKVDDYDLANSKKACERSIAEMNRQASQSSTTTPSVNRPPTLSDPAPSSNYSGIDTPGTTDDCARIVGEMQLDLKKKELAYLQANKHLKGREFQCAIFPHYREQAAGYRAIARRCPDFQYVHEVEENARKADEYADVVEEMCYN